MSRSSRRSIIVFTGGGSGGHRFPLISISERLTKEFDSVYDSVYIGSEKDIELDFLAQSFDFSTAVSVGKLRRYFSFQNFLDLFRVFKGIVQTIFILKSYDRVKLIFSSGGYVSVPVVFAGYLLNIPIVIHEQTARVGLANKIGAVFARRILVSFKESEIYFPTKKTRWVGYPLRKNFGRSLSELADDFKKPSSPIIKKIRSSNRKKILLVAGGANGSDLINRMVDNHLNRLNRKFIIVHQTGRLKHQRKISQNYLPFENLFSTEWIYLLKKIDLYLGRSGAGIVHELMALKKKAIYIPLKIAQNNEQFHNALMAQKNDPSIVIVPENDLPQTDLVSLIKETSEENLVKRTKKSPLQNSSSKIIQEMNAFL